jgi:hypothetical protein
MGRELPSKGAHYFAQRHRRGRKEWGMTERKLMKKMEKGITFQYDV